MSWPMPEPRSILHAVMLTVLGGIHELCKDEHIHPIALFTDSFLTVRVVITGKNESSEGFSYEFQQIKTLVDHEEVSKIAHAYQSATTAGHCFWATYNATFKLISMED